MLGIVKAYTTRVGAGPFPTELFDEYGEHLSRVGHEFGSVTGRRRRCGWFDAVALRRSIVHSSVSGLCITKLDVLDGLDTIRICVGYRINGVVSPEPPMSRRGLCRASNRSTRSCPAGASRPSASPTYAALPGNARRYLERLQSLVDVPLDMISTGPERDQTIVLRHPFGA